MLILFHIVYIAASRECGYGAVRRCGGQLTHFLCAAVARGEDAGCLCSAALVRDDITVVIEVCNILEALVVRHLTDRNKNAVHRNGTGFLVARRYFYTVELVAADEVDYLRVHENLYVIFLAELLDKSLFAPELIASVYKRYALAVRREEERGLESAVSAADNGNILALIKSSIAHRAVGYAPAREVDLAVRSERSVARSGGNYNALALVAV